MGIEPAVGRAQLLLGDVDIEQAAHRAHAGLRQGQAGHHRVVGGRGVEMYEHQSASVEVKQQLELQLLRQGGINGSELSQGPAALLGLQAE